MFDVWIFITITSEWNVSLAVLSLCTHKWLQSWLRLLLVVYACFCCFWCCNIHKKLKLIIYCMLFFATLKTCPVWECDDLYMRWIKYRLHNGVVVSSVTSQQVPAVGFLWGLCMFSLLMGGFSLGLQLPPSACL